MGDYEREQARLEKLMSEALAEMDTEQNEQEMPNDQDSENEIDIVETRSCNTDTDQEISDGETENETNIHIGSNLDTLFYTGKDLVSQWKKHVPNRNRKVPLHNILRQRLPTICAITKELRTPQDIISFFLNDHMIKLIVQYTNQHIDTLFNNFTRSRDCMPTNKTEIQALIGLLYYGGVFKASHLNAEDLFKTDGSGIEIFRLTMSLKRFRFLLSSLRFDDKTTRNERKGIDKLAPIRDYFELFITNCKNGFSPSAYMTVDEKLEAFRGRCGFRQYIPSKPNKYGIKIFALSDAKLFYTSNMEVYVGLQPEGPYRTSNSPQDVVLRLCEPIYYSNRNITLDNWFTSINLVKKLSEKKLTVIGTIRKNKRELPKEFTQPQHPVKSSLFGFSETCTLVSYIPKKNKNILLVSSVHDDDCIDKSTPEDKPMIIIDYNKTKGGVDTVDQLCSYYDCARTTNRWPMVIFYSILNVAAINSHILYKWNNPDIKTSRREFLKQISMELILPELRVRRIVQQIPRSMKLRLSEICGLEIPQNNDDNPRNTTGRCNFCDSKKNRKTRYFCRVCKKWLCLEHSEYICEDCSDKFSN